MKDTQFELAPELYDQLVDWPKRLAHETPFFRRVFADVDARRVVDVACGVGRHAALFASWGCQTLGVDGAAAMIEFCRERHGVSDALRWRAQSFDTLHAIDETFDAATCLGNSLALAGDSAALERAVSAIARLVRPDGACVLHVLNVYGLPDGPIVWQKTQRVAHGESSYAVIKGVHRAGDHGFVDVVALNLEAPDLAPLRRCTPLLTVTPDDLMAPLRKAGFDTFACYGDHACRPFDAQTSTDLLLVARN